MYSAAKIVNFLEKPIKILLVVFLIGLAGALVFERCFLTKTYDFEIGKLAIEVVADECETCVMDYPVNNTIRIRNTENNTSESFDFYTEGPRLEFGFNEDNSELAVNCPGFSTLFINVGGLDEIEVAYDSIDPKLDDFRMTRVITKHKQLVLLRHARLPDKNWE